MGQGPTLHHACDTRALIKYTEETLWYIKKQNKVHLWNKRKGINNQISEI